MYSASISAPLMRSISPRSADRSPSTEGVSVGAAFSCAIRASWRARERATCQRKKSTTPSGCSAAASARAAIAAYITDSRAGSNTGSCCCHLTSAIAETVSRRSAESRTRTSRRARSLSIQSRHSAASIGLNRVATRSVRAERRPRCRPGFMMSGFRGNTTPPLCQPTAAQ